jgi:hypothetical protein
MRRRAACLLLLLLFFPRPATTQALDLKSEPAKLPTGETLLNWGVLSYTKLRRGTAIEMRYQLAIDPDACFYMQSDSAGHSGLTLEVTGEPALTTTVLEKKGAPKQSVIHGEKFANCSSLASFKIRLSTSPDAVMGLTTVRGKLTWQARNAKGDLPRQDSSFEFPLEIVEQGDRTARYNESFGYRPKADLLWRIPALPFVLTYCAIVGGDCPE